MARRIEWTHSAVIDLSEITSPKIRAVMPGHLFDAFEIPFAR